MIIGQYKSKLTDKNRLSVPKKIRDEFGEEMIIARWYESCLVLVPKGYWQIFIKRIRGRSKLVVEPVRDVERFIYGSAFEVVLDSQGRFILPEVLALYSNIKDDVVYIGLGDRVEIWANNEWEKLEKDIETKANKAIEAIAKAEVKKIVV
jgi:MraZ protein